MKQNYLPCPHKDNRGYVFFGISLLKKILFIAALFAFNETDAQLSDVNSYIAFNVKNKASSFPGLLQGDLKNTTSPDQHYSQSAPQSALIILISNPGTDNQTVCKNSSISEIAYFIANGAPGQATITGLPTGITINYVDSILILDGSSASPGDYTYTITTTGSSPISTNGTIHVQHQGVELFSSAGTDSQAICLNGSITNIVYTLSGTATGASVTGLPPGITGANTAGNTFTISGALDSVGLFSYSITTSGTACSSESTDGIIAINNYWTGTVDDDWNTAGNWTGNAVPSTSCADVFVPSGTPYQPVLNTPAPSITNLHILSDAVVKIDSSGTLPLGGTIYEDSGAIFDVTAGTLELNGATQRIDGNSFFKNTINNLIASSGDSGVIITGGATDTLNITGTLSLGNDTTDLTATDGHLTLRSTIFNTANVGPVSSDNTITGNVTVERYINTGIGHIKSWQFIATNTVGQTIHDSWMEKGDTLISGYGTWVTASSGTGGGFDAYSVAPSMKYYNPTTDAFIGVGNPSLTPLYNLRGYLLFVRGDRTVRELNAAPNPTVLRSTGTLITGTQYSDAAPPGKYQFVGNPYASAVDLKQLGGFDSGELDENILVWDPALWGYYGVGGYETITPSTGYRATPGTSDIYDTLTSYDHIQSGQGFVVHNSTTDSLYVTFTEASKVNGSMLVNRKIPQKLQMLSTNLYALKENKLVIADGNRVVFDDKYSNKVDGNDAIKLKNAGENFGLSRDGKIMAVEARNYPKKNDTIYYNMSNLLHLPYLLRFVPENMDMDRNMDAVLIDNYLKTQTPISLKENTEIPVLITADTASNLSDRFMLVIGSALASNPVSVETGNTNLESPSISVYPNPIDGKSIHIHFVNQPAGKFSLRLLNSYGRTILRKSVSHLKGTSDESINLNSTLSHGVYELEIIKPDGQVQNTKVVY